MLVLLAVVVFVSAAFLDYAYVRYQEAVARKTERAAGAWSIAIYVVGSIGWVSILQASMWFMIPELLGLYTGTVIAIRRSKRLHLHDSCQALK